MAKIALKIKDGKRTVKVDKNEIIRCTSIGVLNEINDILRTVNTSKKFLCSSLYNDMKNKDLSQAEILSFVGNVQNLLTISELQISKIKVKPTQVQEYLGYMRP